MNTKGEIRLRDFVIGILLVSVIAMGVFLFVADMDDYYGVGIGSNYTSTFLGAGHSFNDSLREIQNISRSVEHKVESSANASGIYGFTIVAGQSVVSATKMSFNSLRLFIDLISNLGTMVGIPAYIIGAFISLAVAVLGFLFISALWRWHI